MLKVTMAVTVLVTLVLIFELLRRKALREKYAFVWIVTALLIVMGSIFPDVFFQLSSALGFETFANFVLVFSGLIILFITMQLSLELGKVEDQNQRLAEELALLKMKNENP
jgi:hypothetical protein